MTTYEFKLRQGVKFHSGDEMTADDVKFSVTAMAPEQRCTVASVAGHAMYERSNPYEEFFAGGKLEGAGKVGERYVGLRDIRDPYTIANVDRVIAWAREQVRARFGDSGYELHYNVYGRDGVMGELDPLRHQTGHELAVMVQGVAPTAKMAEEVAMMGCARCSTPACPT